MKTIQTKWVLPLLAAAVFNMSGCAKPVNAGAEPELTNAVKGMGQSLDQMSSEMNRFNTALEASAKSAQPAKPVASMGQSTKACCTPTYPSESITEKKVVPVNECTKAVTVIAAPSSCHSCASTYPVTVRTSTESCQAK